MQTKTASAIAHPNIAFIKYWGNRDDALRLPVNGSISMNLEGLETRTMVTFDKKFSEDTFKLNGRAMVGVGLDRVVKFLDIVRSRSKIFEHAEVISENNFPTGAGIASSAAAFAALSLAASHAAGLALNESGLSALARRGSGSASRSVPGGFVEWFIGIDDTDSYAVSIAPPSHWVLVDCIAVVKGSEKKVGSSEGHGVAASSPLQAARVEGAVKRLDFCREAIMKKDFSQLAEVVELDSNLMHAVMMTSIPALFYWEPVSLELIKEIPAWRKEGLQVCYTLDAGPNIHAICSGDSAEEVRKRLSSYPGVNQIFQAHPGGPAKNVPSDINFSIEP